MPDNDNAGVRYPPPLLFFVLFILGFLIHVYKPLHLVGNDWRTFFRVVGGVLVVAALALNFAAIATFRKHQTSIVPVKPSTYFVKEGVYSFTRNPMYLALCLLYLGGVFVVNSIWPLIFLPICILITQIYVIHREEKYLERKFGNDFLEYQSRVRRWI